ncbi:MAG: hypothetical protein HY917_01530 [Candidatus Diapherotrites archaeon]|nr:hypothetical protein [Candidatus Diapherotrites archaeon]
MMPRLTALLQKPYEVINPKELKEIALQTIFIRHSHDRQAAMEVIILERMLRKMNCTAPERERVHQLLEKTAQEETRMGPPLTHSEQRFVQRIIQLTSQLLKGVDNSARISGPRGFH